MARLLVVLFAIPAAAATRTWTGAAGTLWSNAGNWGGTAPVAGDDLVFPSGAANLSNTNDLGAGFMVNSLTIGTGYTLAGSSIALGGGGMTFTGSSGPILNIGISLIASQQWTTVGATFVSVNGVISGSSNLALAGPGSFMLANINTATGTLSLNGVGSLLVDSGGNSWPGPVILNNGLTGINGGSALGPVTVNNAFLGAGGLGAGGNESTGNLALLTGSTLEAFVQFSPNLNVTGSVTITNSTLTIPTFNTVLAGGSVLTLIVNDGSDPIAGTFNGVPEGGTVTAATGQPFKVSYVGGTGNDLVLTAGLTPPTVALAPSLNPANVGQTVTFTATVAPPVAGPANPTGSVTFYDGATPIGSAPLNPSGVATFATSSLTAGPHSITAAYGGDAFYATKTSGIVTESVSGGAAVPALDPLALAALVFVLAAYAVTRSISPFTSA